MKKNLPFQTIRPVPPRLEYLLDYGLTFVQARLYSEKSGITARTFKPSAFHLYLISKNFHSKVARRNTFVTVFNHSLKGVLK